MLSAIFSLIARVRLFPGASTLVFRCSSSPWDSSPLSGFIQRDIGRRGGLPREILGHPVGLESAPGLWVTESLQRRADALQERLTSVLLKLETGALAGFRFEVLDGVVEADGGAHDRDGAVTQAVNLIESTGLVARGHEEHVRPGLDFVRERVVKPILTP